MTPTCVICGRPTEDGYACSACTAEAAQKLRMIVDLGPEARNVAYGLTRGAKGAASGKPGSRSPGNDDALDALGEVQGALTTWARHVAEERGMPAWDGTESPDYLIRAAKYLGAHLEWMRHRPEVDEAFRDFADCARRLRGVVDGPRAKKYLGPCGAILECNPIRCAPDCPPGCGVTEPVCEGDVYGPAGGKTGRCRTCGAEVDQAERKAWLDEQVRDKAFRAAHIADAYGINVNTIRTWAHERPALHDHSGTIVRPARPAKLREHARDRLGKPLYLVGDVLDLAREAALRRAENEAHRARRADERLSA